MSTNVSVACVTPISFVTNRRTSRHLLLVVWLVAGGHKARVRTPTRATTTICDAWLVHRIFGL